MRYTSLLLGVFTALTVFAFSEPLRAEKPTKAEIASMGKAATAYVEMPKLGSGTAFCIHPTGLFITNEHVVHDDIKGEITLVLEPGLKKQRVLKARVIRVDEAKDLALLRVENAGELPGLKLGSVDGLSELMDVVAFGFPLGRALSPDKNDYPAISVNAGRVTALRHKDGELQQIQIDVALTFGNSGGPVLDDQGKVVGVVVSGIRGAQAINQAIPVSHLETFLKTPDIQVTFPELTSKNLDQSHEFKARVVSLFPTQKAMDVQLILKVDNQPERRQKMEFKDGYYRVSTPIIQPGREEMLDISAEFEESRIRGLTIDREILVGARKIKLGECRRIQRQPKPVVISQDGKKLEGNVDGLSKFSIRVGGQNLVLDLSSANSIVVQAHDPVKSVQCTVLVTQDDKVIGRVETSAVIQGAVVPAREIPDMPDARGGPDAPDVPEMVDIRPARIAEGKVTKMLPDTATDIRVGGNGRYFVLHLPKLKKLAVFDAIEAKISHYIPLSEDKIVYAAGLDKIIVGVTSKGLIERWNLITGEKENSRAIPNAADVTCVSMGSASSGPFMVNGEFFDLQTLKLIPVKMQGIPGWWHPISADGTVFGGWKPHESPSECSTLVLSGREIIRTNSAGLGHIVPGPDGRIVYTAKGLYTNQFKSIPGSPPNNSYCLPATEGDYVMVVSSSEGAQPGTIGLYLIGSDQPLVKNVGIAHSIKFDSWDRELFGPWKRIYFIPRAELFVIFPPSNDRLDLYHFNLDEAMEVSGLDYLLVTSRPPRTAKAGKPFEYTVATKVKRGPVTVTLNSGPKGMQVTPAGIVRWTVPGKPKTLEEDVILTIKDQTDREIFHSFKLQIVK